MMIQCIFNENATFHCLSIILIKVDIFIKCRGRSKILWKFIKLYYKLSTSPPFRQNNLRNLLKEFPDATKKK